MSIADRLAFSLEREATKRLQIVSSVKAAYAMRSQLVHHSEQPSDLLCLQHFGEIAWRFFVTIVTKAVEAESSKLAFIDAIERVKYS